jgi:hypothetical protein
VTDDSAPPVGPARNRKIAARRLIDRDRAFIREYLQFGYMHHVIAAEALRSAYERADETATIVREQVERTDRATAAVMASSLNDGARVQTVVVARLLSEYAAAIEDLGALLHGIRHRARGGVMVKYLEATVSGAADMLDLVIDRGGAELPRLLDLPDLRSLGDSVDPSALEALKHDYDALGDHLIQIGGQYRDKGPQGIATEADEVPEDRVAIVLGLKEPDGDEPERRGGLLAQAHNKIKHRFAVIEDIKTLGSAAGGQILYTHYPRDQRSVLRLVHNVTQVALAGAELAALMLTLDEQAGMNARPPSSLRVRRSDAAG